MPAFAEAINQLGTWRDEPERRTQRHAHDGAIRQLLDGQFEAHGEEGLQDAVPGYANWREGRFIASWRHAFGGGASILAPSLH